MLADTTLAKLAPVSVCVWSLFFFSLSLMHNPVSSREPQSMNKKKKTEKTKKREDPHSVQREQKYKTKEITILRNR